VTATLSDQPARPLVIVPCGARKLPEPAPAGQLNTGSYHAACRRAAAALTGPDRILILSALHGLLPLDRVIAPYELRMGQPGTVSTATLREQAEQLRLVDQPHVIVLAGRAYTTAALTVWPHATTPLAGAGGLGRQLGGPGRHHPQWSGSGMLTAAAAACGAGNRSGAGQVWLGLLSAAVLVVGWAGLYWVAAGYPVNPIPVRRRAGAALEGLAFLCAAGTFVAWLQVRTDRCGRIVGSAATWEGWLFLVAVVSIVASVLTRRMGAGWIAAAAVVIADFVVLLALLGLRPAAYRQEAVVLLLVHAICTAVATWWARQLRSSPAHSQLRRPRQAGFFPPAGSSCYC
jgi:hypothetical protein